VSSLSSVELAFVAAVIAALWVLPSYVVAKYAEAKGHSFGLFLFVGLCVSWFLAAFAALVVEDRRT
jgi:hypothetical protein